MLLRPPSGGHERSAAAAAFVVATTAANRVAASATVVTFTARHRHPRILNDLRGRARQVHAQGGSRRHDSGRRLRDLCTVDGCKEKTYIYAYGIDDGPY